MESERPTPDLATFDPTNHSWWQWREMGSPDDPYNQIPKLDPEDPLYKEYLDITEAGYEAILKVGLDEKLLLLIPSLTHTHTGVRERGGLGVLDGPGGTIPLVWTLHLFQVLQAPPAHQQDACAQTGHHHS